MNDETAEAEPKCPRVITVRPTFETAKRLLGREDDDDPEGSDSLLFAWGELWVPVEVESWEDFDIPDGHEIADDDEREEYEAYLDSKRNG